MNFRSAASAAFSEIETRHKMRERIMSFGNQYLDESTGGILPTDIIALGAPSGVGKTQFCCNMAIANIAAGKKVHLLALEASDHEIEKRMKYPIVVDFYYSDPNRPTLSLPLNFRNWVMGFLIDEMKSYEDQAAKFFDQAYKDIFLFYKQGDFGSDEFVQNVMSIAHTTDLIIVDHIHYFDFDDDNENRAIKNVVKTARTLGLELEKPIVLVGHLRKKDRNNDDLVAGLEEFHGSSDFYKIATKVITISPGNSTPDGKGFYTYFRVPKNRIDGSSTRFSAQCIFDPKKGAYQDGYQIGYANQSRAQGFKEIATNLRPDWSKSARQLNGVSGDDNANVERQSEVLKPQGRSRSIRNFAPYSDRD